MIEAFLITAVVVGVLACPVMMYLGRRGIGPGCAMTNCAPKAADELGDLRRREREIELRIAEIEVAEERSIS